MAVAVPCLRDRFARVGRRSWADQFEIDNANDDFGLDADGGEVNPFLGVDSVGPNHDYVHTAGGDEENLILDVDGLENHDLDAGGDEENPVFDVDGVEIYDLGADGGKENPVLGVDGLEDHDLDAGGGEENLVLDVDGVENHDLGAEREVARDDGAEKLSYVGTRARWQVACMQMLWRYRADAAFDQYGRTYIKFGQRCRSIWESPASVTIAPCRRIPLLMLCMLQISREQSVLAAPVHDVVGLAAEREIECDVKEKPSSNVPFLDYEALLAARCSCRVAAGLQASQPFTFRGAPGNDQAIPANRPPRFVRGGRKHRRSQARSS
jgi:hypothetical protein